MIACALCPVLPWAVAGASVVMTFGFVVLAGICHSARPVKVCSECGRPLIELEKPEGRCRPCVNGRLPAVRQDNIEDLR